ncbi:hypothetical protein MMB68_11225 [Priestia sp. Y58]|uniref:hypothetical protein n=1 Tax=Priestia TaxID=2800373 RepID=UPI001C8EDE1E|nr:MULTISPECIES: hypothetical protein [Priestia]MBX9987004.1 hypothetical protein [Priestia aryabhattai]MBX9999111.1 hypothetical protein [Priestia aryabhattai]MCZ8495315.1 hypothetical protein [Priestia megaterium]MDG0030129.1 hypothetical protein [Priestia sp. Y58]MDG0059830.1 hypothetical protein [Priestia sp. P5]
MIGGQGEDSQEKRSPARKSKAVSQTVQIIYPIYLSLGWTDFIMSQSLFLLQ